VGRKVPGADLRAEKLAFGNIDLLFPATSWQLA